MLTHLEHFADAIHTLFRAKHAVWGLEFVSYSKDGPEISEHLPALDRLLGYARDQMNARNDEYRCISVRCLRHFVERFVKDLYVCETGQSLSRRFQSASWPELRKLLKQCKKFHAADESLLEHTHDFCSGHLHEDDAMPQAVPNPHQVKPHVDEMQNVLDKYRDVLGV